MNWEQEEREECVHVGEIKLNNIFLWRRFVSRIKFLLNTSRSNNFDKWSIERLQFSFRGCPLLYVTMAAVCQKLRLLICFQHLIIKHYTYFILHTTELHTHCIDRQMRTVLRQQSSIFGFEFGEVIVSGIYLFHLVSLACKKFCEIAVTRQRYLLCTRDTFFENSRITVLPRLAISIRRAWHWLW